MSVSYGFWDAARVKRERGDGGYSTQLSDTAELAACGEGEPEVQSLQVRRRARSGRGGARRALRAATRGGADPARASGTAARTSVGALARLARAVPRVSCNPRHLYPSAFGGACSTPGRALRCLGLRCALRRQCSLAALACAQGLTRQPALPGAAGDAAANAAAIAYDFPVAVSAVRCAAAACALGSRQPAGQG
jgi:hypothetical protein